MLVSCEPSGSLTSRPPSCSRWASPRRRTRSPSCVCSGARARRRAEPGRGERWPTSGCCRSCSRAKVAVVGLVVAGRPGRLAAASARDGGGRDARGGGRPARARPRTSWCCSTPTRADRATSPARGPPRSPGTPRGHMNEDPTISSGPRWLRRRPTAGRRASGQAGVGESTSPRTLTVSARAAHTRPRPAMRVRSPRPEEQGRACRGPSGAWCR